jgi:hypothetical protein
MENFDEEEDRYFQYLLEVGAFEIDGVSEDGELMFKPNPEKMKEYAPEMFEMMQEDIENSLLELYKDGLVEMEYDEDLGARFKISEQAKEEMRKFGFYHIDNQD